MMSAKKGLGMAALVAVLLSLPLLGRPGPASACLTVGGKGAQIQIADEEAIIVWDAAHHREDFIRQATFRTGAHDFGFLVPTPTVPTLMAVRPAVFTLMERLSALSLSRQLTGSVADGPKKAGVEVIRTQRVGAYDAAVLSADDLRGLARWLSQHGYTVPPGMSDWLTPYVEAHWTITAFKIAKDATGAPTASLPPVRLSFSTDAPFYPYREPAVPVSGIAPPRLLRVFFMSDSPAIGGFRDAAAKTWPGRVVTTHNIDGLDPEFRPDVADRLLLHLGQMPSPLWVTMFEDRSSPRPAVADVYFTPGPAKTALRLRGGRQGVDRLGPSHDEETLPGGGADLVRRRGALPGHRTAEAGLGLAHRIRRRVAEDAVRVVAGPDVRIGIRGGFNRAVGAGPLDRAFDFDVIVSVFRRIEGAGDVCGVAA
jgi:hypothetical protein